MFWKTKRILGDLRYAVKRHTVYRWQRGQRGWSDSDAWSFDHYLAVVIAGGVRKLATNNHGHPANICTCKDKMHDTPETWNACDGEERWLAVLDEIASGLEQYAQEFDWKGPHDVNVYRAWCQEREKKCQRSLELFKEHFGDLWD